MSEKRRVVKSGKTSCVIALPKKWIDSNHIQPGDYLNVFSEENAVRITKDSSERKKETRIPIKKEQKDSMEKRIISAYLAGFNTITVYFPEGIESYMADVQKIVDMLFGIEITKTDEKTIWISSMINEENVPTQDLITRMVFLTNPLLTQ
jgi:hypothetical protein